MTDGNPIGVVLVEGESDRNVVETLADAHGIDLTAHRVHVISMNGATNIAKHLRRHQALARAGRLAGLCDSAEAPVFRGALQGLGLGPDLEAVGFFICQDDLEDELIRALGAERVVELIEEAGEGESLAKFQQQPHQRERSLEAQVHRFSGVKSGRKTRYGGLLAGALEEGNTPEPLRRLMDRIRDWTE